MSTISPTGVMAMRNAILQQNSALREAASGSDALGGKPASVTGVGGFADALKAAVEGVNAQQGAAENISVSYEKGETSDIASVMLAKQKAGIGFEATLQVRNKLLSAYKDIMSMPV